MRAAPVLDCRSVAASYGTGRVLDGLHLDVAAGRVLAVLGESGSGKTTLVAAIAGFHPVDEGTITIDGRVVSGPGTHVGPEHRRVGVVFQHYALWPHLDAADTVAYPLRRRGLPRATARARALDLLDRLGLAGLAHRRPPELSGGQQQRVGLARALAAEPVLFLFDEPTAHLDLPLRRALQDEIAEQRRRLGAAAVYATHDAEEALAVADEVALLRGGRIHQRGTPQQVYEQPIDLAAARLTGPASVVVVDLVPTGPGRVAVVLPGAGPPGVVAAPDGGIGGSSSIEVALPTRHAGPSTVIVRPEWVTLGGPWPATVERRWFRGPHTDLLLDTPAGPVQARVAGCDAPGPGRRVGWGVTALWPVGAPTARDPDVLTTR